MTIARKTGGRPSKRPTNAELAMLYSVMTAKGNCREIWCVRVHGAKLDKQGEKGRERGSG